MANVIFAGENVRSLVLPLIFFHQIQLMVCAVIARNYAAGHARHEAIKQGAVTTPAK
jgi:sodium/bile acid cotransporter 7